MEGTISVIVPVYNVSRYLPQCISSILSQDYKALEVILIDDGSTDSSGRLCDQYAQQDKRIMVFHQKNGGAAAAKNTGLRAATGEYLSFVDSDDFLDAGAYAYMTDLLRETGADVVQCAYRDVYCNRTEDQILKPGRSSMTGKEYLVRFTIDWTCSLLWNKLYRRKIFDDVFFEEGHKIDDEYFTYQGIMNAEKVVCDDRIIYNYRKRASSVMLLPASRKQIALDRIDYLNKRRVNVLRRFPELRRVFDIHYIDTLVNLSRDEIMTPESMSQIKLQIKAYFQEKEKTIPGVSMWPALLKLYYSDPEKLLRKGTPVIHEIDAQGYFQ